MGNELAILFDKDWEFLHEFVINALTDTDLCSDLVFKGTKTEGKRWEALVGLSKELSCLLELEVICVLELTLKHSGALLGLLWLTLASRDIDVNVNNFTSSESPFFDLLQGNFFTNDDFVAVNAILLNDVGKDSFNDIASEFSCNFVDGFSNFAISALVANDALCSSKSMIGSKDHISFTTIDFTFTYNNSLGSVSSISIKMSTSDNLDNISVFKRN